jgi:Spy/CpxP family protein refolding chaperone
MKNKWLKIILAASLALNLAFISTTLYRVITDHARQDISKKKRYAKTGFNLRQDQKEKIKKIVKQFRVNLLEYKQDILDKRIAIIEAMSGTETNLPDIEEKTNQLNHLENRLNMLFVEALIQINSLLEPEQRLKLLYKLSQNWFFIHKPPRRPSKKGERHD